MRFRYLRIIWTVFCGIACVLLVVLWVRSYSQANDIFGLCNPYIVDVASVRGQIEFEVYDPNADIPLEDQVTGMPSWHWELQSRPAPVSTTGSYFKNNAPRIIKSLGFGWYFAPKDFDLLFPYWFAVVITATLGTFAALPWIRLSKRFSLRTLLIATTLVAVVLELIVWLR